MKFAIILFLLFNSTATAFAQSAKTDFEIYFGNEYEKDTVSLKINGTSLVNNKVLEKTMVAPKSLVLTQEKGKLVVRLAYKPAIIFQKIKIQNSQLNLIITINGTSKDFSIDLKKGKYIFVERDMKKYQGNKKPFPEINQSKLPALYL